MENQRIFLVLFSDFQNPMCCGSRMDAKSTKVIITTSQKIQPPCSTSGKVRWILLTPGKTIQETTVVLLEM